MLSSVVINRRRIATPVLRIEEHFPKEIEVNEAPQFDVKTMADGYRIYRSTVLVKRRQRVTRKLHASIASRGEYRFEHAEFHAGDFLGFREFDYKMNNERSIVIYPAPIKNKSLLKAFTDAMDELSLDRRMLEDPISVRGYREYTGREPMRMISWKQSAVRNELIVKQFDPTVQSSVCVVLDVSFYDDFDTHFSRQETCFSLARSICDILEERGVGYELITNALISNNISFFHSRGTKGDDYRKILYSLGYAKHGYVCSSEQLIASAFNSGSMKLLVIFITTCRSRAADSALRRVIARNKSKLFTVYADEFIPSCEQEEGRKMKQA